MPDIHLRFGGSTIDRTFACPDWRTISDQAPQIDRTSAAAERGSKLHDIMERHYLEGTDITALASEADLGQDDIDMLLQAQAAAEALFDKYGIEDFEPEPFVTFPGWRDVAGGSADMIACSDEVVIVLDWKFGRVPVKSHNQLLFYAACAEATPGTADMFGTRRLVTVIVQPEVSEDAIVQEHYEKDRVAFIHRMQDTLVAAHRGTMNGIPGDHCKYCPGVAYCPAKKGQAIAFVDTDFESTQSFNEALALLDDMKAMVREIESEMMHRLEAGLPVEGFKLVEKQARSHWADAPAALETFKRSKLRKEIYLEPDKLRSPTQIKKAIKAAGKDYDVEPMVSRATTGVTFAPVTDKREAILVNNKLPDALDKVLKSG